MRYTATTAEKSINYQVEHQCPQCGAPITLGEADRFFECEFCRVRSFISQKGYFRYLFPPSTAVPPGKEILYIPYWRFKGALFSCSLEDGVDHRFIDVSHLALTEHAAHFPPSLGLRAQALRLKLVSADSAGTFLRPGGLRETMAVFHTRLNAQRANNPVIHQDYIGETASLIYSPFYLNGRQLVDAILNEDTGTALAENMDIASLPTCRPERETRFVPGLCPACGWDLTGDRQSLALVCRNCETLWHAGGDRLKRIRFGCSVTGDEYALLMPFWQIAATVRGITLASYANLVQVANLPKVVQPDWHDQPFTFWAPAFKIRPKTFLRLNKKVTFAQPRDELTQGFGQRPMHPVTLPATEAVETMKITLAAIMRPAKKMMPRLPDITITPTAITLVFLPFTQRHHDLFNPALNVSINKNTLAHAANI